MIGKDFKVSIDKLMDHTLAHINHKFDMHPGGPDAYAVKVEKMVDYPFCVAVAIAVDEICNDN